jgi:hypothetical protein
MCFLSLFLCLCKHGRGVIFPSPKASPWNPYHSSLYLVVCLEIEWLGKGEISLWCFIMWSLFVGRVVFPFMLILQWSKSVMLVGTLFSELCALAESVLYFLAGYTVSMYTVVRFGFLMFCSEWGCDLYELFCTGWRVKSYDVHELWSSLPWQLCWACSLTW